MDRAPAFDKHLFISYAHLDNQPLTPQDAGWVSRFHDSLEAMLSMRLGRRAEIWRDRKLSGNDVFAEEILAQFPRTALLISVLTPRYVESDWCTREVREFCDVAERSGGIVVDNKSRVIKVIKTPVESEGPLPPIMQDVLGYPFYTFDDDGTPLELDPVYGAEMGPRFHLKVAKLAWDIAQQLKRMTAASQQVQPPAGTPDKPMVYLAECSWDQRQVREAVEADLRLHGYPVVPDRPLPRDEATYRAEVERLLASAKFSIHLVGTTYGAVPDGPAQKSIVVLQNELAVARAKAAGLRRVIWIPDGPPSDHPEQQRFVAALHSSAEAQSGADLMIGDQETLKAAIHLALSKLQPPQPAPLPAAGAAGLVYVICDERDRKATTVLRKFLKSHGIDPQIPVFEGDAATVRQANQDLLAQCDAVIVFYGAGDESWKRTVDSDLRKMPGYRAGSPLLGRYTYLAEPVTEDKQDLIDMDEPNLVNGLGGFSEAALQPFVQLLQRRRRDS